MRDRLHLSRRGLLGSAAALSALTGSALGSLGASSGSKRRLLLVMVDGGWDVTFGFDPKPPSEHVDGPHLDMDPEVEGDIETVEQYGPFQIAVNYERRPQVASLFSSFHDRLCVINGIWVGTISHFEARTRMITGTDDRHAPDLATIAGVDAGDDLPIAAMDLSGLGRVGPFGSRTAMYGRRGQLTGIVDPTQRMPSRAHPDIRGGALAKADRSAIHSFLTERWERDPRRSQPRGDRVFDEQLESILRAERLLEMTVPSGSVNTLREQMILALDLLDAGICHTVTVGSLSFDTHSDGLAQHDRWDDLCGDIGFLVSQMEARGLESDTTVAVLSEFGRTPLRNVVGGTDHFPHTSAMLFGAGIAGGRILGATNDRVQSLPIDMQTGKPDARGDYLRPNQVVAGLLEALDVDPEPWLPGVVPFRAFQA